MNFRRVPCLISYLFFNINRHTGFEFHNEFILADGDFFNQPPDKQLVVFRNGSWLFLQEVTHIGDAFFQFIPPDVIKLCFLLFFVQAVNLVGDKSVIAVSLAFLTSF